MACWTAAAVVAAFGFGWLTFSPLLTLTVAALVAVGAAVVGVQRTRRAGRVDLFHPLLFPTAYIAVATLAPVAWIWSGQGDLGFVTRDAMSERTPLLMALAVLGFTLGAAVPFRPLRRRGKPLDPGLLLLTGRALLLVALALAARDYLAGAVITRSLGQDVYSSADVVTTIGFMAAPAAATMIFTARYQSGRHPIGADVLPLLALIGLLGLNGRRGAALSVVVIGLVFITRRAVGTWKVAAGMGATAVFAYAVVIYRTAQLGGVTALPTLAVPLRDLGSVAFTTGMTDLSVTYPQSTTGGSTIVAGLLRQLPSPIAVRLFGAPDDTGTFVFRNVTGLTASNQGYGFSIPAEGLLNFGVVGVLVLSLVAGIAVAWLYGRFDPTSSRTVGLLYPLAIGTLPFAWRSDTLGAVKGVFYPAVALALVLIVARSIASAYKPATPRSVARARLRV
ncbi:O-antigen polysaccharide polymerase Wzy [Phycicoccus avicenniae]|uniref:O-antigen polysaccharide polymerase Wzy n=1 Tax=Phycicoccus avicenniae TaxID=2828860 RepID=UPI003D26D063